MKDVEHDRQSHSVVLGQLFEDGQLGLVAVNHGNPSLVTLRVPLQRFAKRLLQHLAGFLLQARPYPLVLRTGTRGFRFRCFVPGLVKSPSRSMFDQKAMR